MGLFKLALIGGAAYYAGKKFGGNDAHPNGPMNNYDPSQGDNWGNNRWGHGRCGRKRQQQQQQQQETMATREVATEGVYDYPSEKKQQQSNNSPAGAVEQHEYDYPPHGWQGYSSTPAQPGYYWYGPSPPAGTDGYTAPAGVANEAQRMTMSSPRQSTGKEMVKIEAASVNDNDAHVPVNAANLPPYSTTTQGGVRGLSPRQRMYPYPYEKEPMV